MNESRTITIQSSAKENKMTTERDERQTPRFNLWSRSFWRNPFALTFCATITVPMHLALPHYTLCQLHIFQTAAKFRPIYVNDRRPGLTDSDVISTALPNDFESVVVRKLGTMYNVQNMKEIGRVRYPFRNPFGYRYKKLNYTILPNTKTQKGSRSIALIFI